MRRTAKAGDFAARGIRPLAGRRGKSSDVAVAGRRGRAYSRPTTEGIVLAKRRPAIRADIWKRNETHGSRSSCGVTRQGLDARSRNRPRWPFYAACLREAEKNAGGPRQRVPMWCDPPARPASRSLWAAAIDFANARDASNPSSERGAFAMRPASVRLWVDAPMQSWTAAIERCAAIGLIECALRRSREDEDDIRRPRQTPTISMRSSGTEDAGTLIAETVPPARSFATGHRIANRRSLP